MTRLAPPEVFYGTRFGPKHQIMVQLAKIHCVGITDPFLELRSPSWGSEKVLSWANQVLLGPSKVSKFHFYSPKMDSICVDHPDGALSDISDHIWAIWWPFQRPKGRVRDYSRPQKGLYLLKKWPFESSKKGPEGPEMGQLCLPSDSWPVGPLCGVWNQIWCRARLPEGLKESYRG